MTKARGLQGCGPRRRSGSHFTCSWEWKECEGMNPHTPKGTPMLGVGISKGLLIFRAQFQGSKPIALKISLYHWKDIETYMFEMGSQHSFGHLKHKLWPKESLGVKLAVWLPTTKSRESTRFPCVKATCDISLKKSLNKGYNFASDLNAIGGLHKKLCALKAAKVPTLGISGLPLGSPKTKSHLDVGPMERRMHKTNTKWLVHNWNTFGARMSHG